MLHFNAADDRFKFACNPELQRRNGLASRSSAELAREQ
jgi:hypothetical protein